MSNATELMRRALEAYDHKEEPYFERLHHAFEEIRTYLSTHSDDADEPVAWFEYAEHADAWFLSYRYNPNAKTKPLYLHPPRPAEPEADELHEVVEKLVKWNKDYPSTRVYGYGDIKQIAEEMEAINAQAIAALAKAKPAEPAARKPMTREEIIQGVTVDTSDDFHAGFWAGVRFAEKHHFEGGDGDD